ncbi:hypothetical protein SDC9_169816 [bioreactor metagenome]|uniref:Uncharacterized protein n=1 Tax=bioreactor metagenome TaxID=1076179 RepID=A0A645GF79_9ZZZZ
MRIRSFYGYRQGGVCARMGRRCSSVVEVVTAVHFDRIDCEVRGAVTVMYYVTDFIPDDPAHRKVLDRDGRDGFASVRISDSKVSEEFYSRVLYSGNACHADVPGNGVNVEVQSDHVGYDSSRVG